MALTITEALAEIKTIIKRIEKKRQFVREFLFRQDFLKDPLENQGGSRSALENERQAIADLEARIVGLRRAIQKANESTVVVIGGEARSIADWLVWRREVAPGVQAFLAMLRSGLQQVRTQAVQKGVSVRIAGEAAAASQPNDVVVNIDEKALAAETEELESILGSLDGQLSLKNATTVVDA